MCLGIPMKIVSIDGDIALCERSQIQRNVNIYLLQDQKLMPGNFVLVHVGYAIQIIDQEDAMSSWQLFDQMNGLTE